MKDSPFSGARAIGMANVDIDIEKYLTIEPIMDFDLESFILMIQAVNPVQVNIGADSGNTSAGMVVK